MTNDKRLSDLWQRAWDAHKALESALADLGGALTANHARPIYPARTDRTVVLPAPLEAPRVNEWVRCPLSGIRILRVTDERTNPAPGYEGRSYWPVMSGAVNAWNEAGTVFAFTGEGGELIPMFFDRDKFQARRISVADMTYGGLWLTGILQADASFSYENPYTLYGAFGSKLRKVSVGTAMVGPVDLCDLTDLIPGRGVGTMGGVSVSSAPERLLVPAWGTQDAWTAVLAYDVATGKTRIREMPGIKLHNARIDRTGKWAVLTQSGTPLDGYSPLILWDIEQDTITPLREEWMAAGHYALGWGKMANNAGANKGAADALDWRLRDLLAPGLPWHPTDTLSPGQWTVDSHESWNNAQKDEDTPFVSSVYCTEPPARCWDGEILSVATDGSGTVWRHCHHRSRSWGPQAVFEDQAVVIVNQQGDYALFASNWDLTLGVDRAGRPRRDVFIVELRGGE